MADQEERIIIDVQLDQQKAQKEAQRLEQEIQNLRSRQRELNKAVKDGSISQEQYAKEILAVKTQIKDKSAEQRNAIKVSQAEEGSINALRARLSELTKQRNAVNQSTEEGVREASRLDSQMKQLSQRIKQNEEAGDDYRRSVGDYTNSIKDAIRQHRIMGVTLGDLGDGFQAVNSGIGGTVTKLKALKVALVSTGIGAILVALGTLVTYFTQSQRGADKLSQALTVFGAGLDVIRDRAIAVGEGLYQFFTGNFQQAADTLRASISGIGDEIINESRAALQIERERQQLERDKVDFLVKEEQLRLRIEKLRTAGEDRSRSTLARERDLSEALALTRELTEQRLAFQRREVDVLSRRQALGENMLEDDKQLAETRKDLLGIEAQAEEQIRTITNQINTTRSEGIALIARREKELLDQQKKAQKENLELTKEELALKIEELSEEIALIQENNSIKLSLNKELVDLKLQQQLLGAKAGSDAELTLIKEANFEKLKLDAEYQEQRKEQQIAFEKLLASDIESIEASITDTVRQNVSKRIDEELKQGEIARTEQERKRQSVIDTANTVAGAAQEGTAIQKAAAITSIGASTYAGATAALSPPPIGLGPLAGIPLMVATIAKGLVNAGKVVGLARGGWVRGPGTATSDSVPLMGSDGEVMINANSAKMFPHELSAINVAGGGVPLVRSSTPKTHYATGGIIQANRVANDNINTQASLMRAIEKMPPPVVSFQEFVKNQNRYNNKVNITSV